MSRPDPANWTCTIGEVPSDAIDATEGADAHMRRAVHNAFTALAGRSPDYTFSGWGSPLREQERAVVEDREPSARIMALEHAVALAPFPLEEGDPDSSYNLLIRAAKSYVNSHVKAGEGG